MVKEEDLGSPEFWLDYCESEDDADFVAKIFPEYYRQYYKSYLGPFDADVKEIIHQEAFDFARGCCEKVAKKLRPLATGKNPIQTLKVFYSVKNPEDYEKVVIRFANQYLEQATPKPTPVRARTDDGYKVASGGRVATEQFVKKLVSRMPRTGDGLRWGPMLLPREQARKSNFCVVGMPRSGKTTLLRLLAQSTLWREQKCRLIIYDEKTGAPSAVFQNESELATHGCLFNPFDARSTPWDIAADAQTPHQANEIARTLIPEMGGRENPFFVGAARAVLAAAMVSLKSMRGDDWNLMDLLLAVSSKHIDHTLMKSAPGQEALNTYFGDSNASNADLKKTLATVLHPLMPVAAAWDGDSREKVSIRKWAIEGEGVLMLGNLNAYAAAMRALNRTVLNILIETLLDLTSEQVKETYVFLDEFQSLGYIDNLSTLLRTGPGLGVTTVLGVHDLGLLKETYGQHAEGVLSMCGHFALLRTNSRETARWASELLGEQTIRFRRKSTTEQAADEPDKPPRISTTVSEHDDTRPLVHPDKLLNLQLTSKEEGLKGYFKSTLHPVYKGSLNGSELFPTTETVASENSLSDYSLFQGKKADITDFHPRPDADLTPRESLDEPEEEEDVLQDKPTRELPSPMDSEAYDILRVRRISLKDYSDAHSSG